MPISMNTNFRDAFNAAVAALSDATKTGSEILDTLYASYKLSDDQWRTIQSLLSKYRPMAGTSDEAKAQQSYRDTYAPATSPGTPQRENDLMKVLYNPEYN